MLVKTEIIDLHGIPVAISWKTDKRGVSFRVKPPDGSVSVSAASYISRKDVLDAIEQRYAWIVKAIKKVSSRQRPSSLQYVDGDVVLLFGVEYPLRVETAGKCGGKVRFDGKSITLTVGQNSTPESRRKLLDSFYKERLSMVLQVFQRYYYVKMGCDEIPFSIQRRKSVWGTFNIKKRSIMYNVALAQVDTVFVQYVVLHEMTHQYVHAHNKEFYDRMAAFMPNWRELRTGLKKFAISNVVF